MCLVVGVSDGDTLTARCDAPAATHPVKLKVRIAAIDAPERGQAFGDRSRKNLVQLCLRQRARLEPLYRDTYGRTVANVRCRTEDVGQAQVQAGMAWVYTAFAHQHPALLPLEMRARADRSGLWSQPRPLAPWFYRHRYPHKPPRR